MDDIGDLLGTIFEEGLFGRNREDERREEQPQVVYARFLCGGPKEIDINDR